MNAINIIPAHDTVDLEANDKFVTLTQRTDGVLESVTFHRRYIPDVIRALKEVEGPSDQELMRAIMQNRGGDA